jgi:multidrug efflux system outer membrane protein
VVFDLCNAFFITQWFQLKVARDEATVHFSEQRVEITQMLFKLQLKLQQDVDLAKAMLVADQQMLTATKQSVRDSYAVLALLIGRPATPVLRLDAKRPSFSTLPPLQDLLRIAREKHPSVGVQRSVADYAVAKLRLDQAGLLPQATFNTNYAVGENFAELAASNANTPTRYAAGVSVSVPIFDWGSQLAQVRESRVKLEAEKARLAQVQMDVSTALARLYDTEHNLEQQLSTEIATQVSTENSARLAREQRTAGVVDQLTLANAEINLLTAEGITEATRLLELQNYAALQQAAGGVWSWVQ